MPKAFRPNPVKKLQKKDTYNLSENTRLRGFFETPPDLVGLSYNRAYTTKVVAPTEAAALLDMTYADALYLLQEHNVYPACYRKRSPMYRIGDLVKVAKKTGRPFVIPIGLFVEPSIYYIGGSLSDVARLWHPTSVGRYNSIFEMVFAAGVPVQTMVLSKEITDKVELSFLYMAGGLFHKYNNYIKKLKDTKLTPKRIILCTKFGDRKRAEGLLHRINLQYPGVIITVDQDHLYNLKKIAADRHYRQLEESNNYV